MTLLAKYKNGNYFIEIFDDGTKIRTLDKFETEFKANFPESIDIKITNRCDMGCLQCHEESVVNGKHGNIDLPFLETLHPYTEVALGGGNFLEHPNYLDLLKKLNSRKIFCNITLHQTHVNQSLDEIQSLIEQGLIKGLGISFNGEIEQLKEILTTLNYENIVLHVINGIISIQDLQKISKFKIKPKILILGYKTFGRGVLYQTNFGKEILEKQNSLNRNLKKVLLNFPVVSFDNLALEQLDIKSLITEEQFQEFYMGDDGQHTMYIDLVKEEFARNSRSEIRYEILDNIDKMFEIVKNES